ncbi:MAG TPA: CGNR zinc finger domain-containing protein, partial [Nitrososphaerales archaeon]|nr:CGNR zinc finger domain-containing protein [Nitrososphaerales archaeon]
LNEVLSKGLERMIVVPTSEGYNWARKGRFTPEVLLYPLAQSAAKLLTSSDLVRVKECANEEQGCGSLFLDCSTQQTRKWCSMESCGTKVKLRKYYARHKLENRS